jgi:putative nucleotidyltransferase with HDIG domain
MQGGKYQRIVENMRMLPPLPLIASRLMNVVNSPYSSADDVAELVEKDPALTAAVIRTANSAFYGIPRTVSSVSGAVVILGFNTIRSIVLSASVIRALPHKQVSREFDHHKFWRHSILTAIAAKMIARACGPALPLDPESAFCAGMLHDIGKIVLEQYAGDEFIRACRSAFSDKIALNKAESDVLGITHAQVGTILADKWALPLDLEQALVRHHDPLHAQDSALIVHCADRLVHEAGGDLWSGEIVDPLRDGTIRSLGLSEQWYDDTREELRGYGDKSTEFLTLVNSGE